MQRLEVSGAVRPLQWSLGVKGLNEELHLVKKAVYDNFINVDMHLTGSSVSFRQGPEILTVSHWVYAKFLSHA